MAEDPADRPAPSSLPPSGLRRASPFALRLGNRELPLGQGVFTIGRSARADFRVDSTRVSRQHARLTLDERGIFVEDLSSRNGLFVNGVLVQRKVPLEPGDQIRIGDQDIALVRRDPRAGAHQDADASPSVVTARADTVDDPTGRVDALDLLGSIVDSALAGGDPEEAESLVSGHLNVLLGEARRERTLKPESCEAAARNALKLADATGKSSWLNYTFELYLAARQHFSLQLVRELFRIAPRVRVSDQAIVRRYLAWARSEPLDAEQQLVVQRLNRFSRL